MDQARNRWAIILAAGEGSRLHQITKDWRGLAAPKQFCSLQGGSTMLQVTLERAKRVAPPDHLIPVVATQHAEWWEGELSEFPVENVVVQPENKGTAPGILLPLLTILRGWRRPAVAVFPSDHYVSDERVLRDALERAFRAIHADPRDERVILLGMRPEGPEPDIGWIESGTAERDGLRSVLALHEKPGSASAERFFLAGALWSSFILVARGEALLRLFEATQPTLLRLFTSTMRHHGWNAATLRNLYAAIPTVDFSREILQRTSDHLRVLPVKPCGWTDIGTPERLAHFLQDREHVAEEPARPARPETRPEPVGATG